LNVGYNIYVMNNFKSILFLIIVLVIVIIVGYWAFVTIEPGNVNIERQRRTELEETNQKLEEEVQQLKRELQIIKEKESVEEELEKEKPPTISTTSLKYQTLIDSLQKLIDDNISMKEKSSGSRVGTVQTFLNTYNNITKKVDNDYGAGTKKDIANFQGAIGLAVDGEAGSSTFLKMIEWLKKQ